MLMMISRGGSVRRPAVPLDATDNRLVPLNRQTDLEKTKSHHSREIQEDTRSRGRCRLFSSQMIQNRPQKDIGSTSEHQLSNPVPHRMVLSQN
ncbi:hypothetical protein RRG08_059938 [Elysia crispata]|uniref:Uncharacterized protein n=1 Tax=Elysia crispata TaxID=231223 RepID=A0AAE0Y6V1_9GAST|nr:hypothetical protein RRG08_059938 [Elysia crispata]